MHNTSSPHALSAWQGQLVKTVFQNCSATYLSENNQESADSTSSSTTITSENIQYLPKNHPLPITEEQSLEIRLILSLLTAIFILVPLCYIPAAFVAFLVKERVAKSKHLQLVSGVSPYLYWVATYLWDLTLFVILTGFIIIALFIFGQNAAEVFIGTASSALCIVCLLLVYGASSIPLCYLYSMLFVNFSTAQIAIMVVNFMTGFVMVLAYYILLNLPKTAHDAAILVNIFRIFPPYNIGEGLINLSTTYFDNTLLEENQNVFAWEITGRNLVFMFVEAIGFFLAVLLIELEGSLSLFSTLLRKSRILNRLQPLPPPPVVNQVDEDVAKEEIYVQELLQMRRSTGNSERGNPNGIVLLIDNLIKTYPVFGFSGKPKFAVRGILLACKEGERFGLFGINGAGKTTTLGILTGEIQLTSGEVYIGGKPLSDPTTQIMIGYCPQVDPLIDLMTGYETLWFFGKIRGIANEILEQRIQDLIHETGLTPYANIPCGKYSGGNKRKLSLAVALIGDPKVLLLDEPSTGMDPEARRHMWNVIEKVSANRTVVLVSHSMEEIEALCTRVGVMVSGRMQCLGSVQHLKNKFGGGYLVEVRYDQEKIEECLTFCYTIGLKTGKDSSLSSIPHRAVGSKDREVGLIRAEEDKREENVGEEGGVLMVERRTVEEEEKINSFPESADKFFITLEERHGGYIRLKVGKGLDLAKAFDEFERNKLNLRIYDYNISQFSLEQVFINLARNQEEEPVKYFTGEKPSPLQ